MKIHFIQNNHWVAPGAFLAWAGKHGCEVSLTKCWEHETVPEASDADLLVVLGGWQSPATTREECGYYDAEAEKRCIRRYVEAGKMVLGVCLGAQLVGEAMGAPYAHSPEPEIGVMQARLTEAGRQDPFLADFPECFPAGEWHNDMPGLTETSVVLAESDGCPRQIVRYGTYVYGFQTHMEFTREILEKGLEKAGGTRPAGGRYIWTPEEILAYDYTEVNRLLESFLDRLTEDYRKKAAV